MEYKNSQILAAVVSEWARPAISQIATGNLMRLPMLQSLQATISSLASLVATMPYRKTSSRLSNPSSTRSSHLCLPDISVRYPKRAYRRWHTT